MTTKDGNAENSFERPRRVAPVESVWTGMGTHFTRTLPARSISVVRLSVRN
jgi:alpha-L-arabinofuranosidase